MCASRVNSHSSLAPLLRPSDEEAPQRRLYATLDPALPQAIHALDNPEHNPALNEPSIKARFLGDTGIGSDGSAVGRSLMDGRAVVLQQELGQQVDANIAGCSNPISYTTVVNNALVFLSYKKALQDFEKAWQKGQYADAIISFDVWLGQGLLGLGFGPLRIATSVSLFTEVSESVSKPIGTLANVALAHFLRAIAMMAAINGYYPGKFLIRNLFQNKRDAYKQSLFSSTDIPSTQQLEKLELKKLKYLETYFYKEFKKILKEIRQKVEEETGDKVDQKQIDAILHEIKEAFKKGEHLGDHEALRRSGAHWAIHDQDAAKLHRLSKELGSQATAETVHRKMIGHALSKSLESEDAKIKQIAQEKVDKLYKKMHASASHSFWGVNLPWFIIGCIAIFLGITGSMGIYAADKILGAFGQHFPLISACLDTLLFAWMGYLDWNDFQNTLKNGLPSSSDRTLTHILTVLHLVALGATIAFGVIQKVDPTFLALGILTCSLCLALRGYYYQRVGVFKESIEKIEKEWKANHPTLESLIEKGAQEEGSGVSPIDLKRLKEQEEDASQLLQEAWDLLPTRRRSVAPLAEMERDHQAVCARAIRCARKCLAVQLSELQTQERYFTILQQNNDLTPAEKTAQTKVVGKIAGVWERLKPLLKLEYNLVEKKGACTYQYKSIPEAQESTQEDPYRTSDLSQENQSLVLEYVNYLLALQNPTQRAEILGKAKEIRAQRVQEDKDSIDTVKQKLVEHVVKELKPRYNPGKVSESGHSPSSVSSVMGKLEEFEADLRKRLSSA